MRRITSPDGTTVSCEVSGRGPALVLVHGSFSDHHTNWEFVAPALRQRFTLYAVARRGRGGTDATTGHTIEDEARDVATLLEAIGEPAFLLGHSYGGHCVLGAALLAPGRVRRLVLYEPPAPGLVSNGVRARLEQFAARGDWDEFAVTFFRDTLRVPAAELDALRPTDLWPPIVGDAPASLQDVRALGHLRVEPERWRSLDIPVLLQIGSESPPELYMTAALAAALPDSRTDVLAGQAHEGMTTAPDLYVDSLLRFLPG